MQKNTSDQSENTRSTAPDCNPEREVTENNLTSLLTLPEQLDSNSVNKFEVQVRWKLIVLL